MLLVVVFCKLKESRKNDDDAVAHTMYRVGQKTSHFTFVHIIANY